MKPCGTIGCTSTFVNGHVIQVEEPAPHIIEVCDRCFEELSVVKPEET